MKACAFLFIFLMFIAASVRGQCTAMPAEPACSGTALANNTNINGGSTYYSNGGTFTGLNLNGGTLLLCSGTTTLSGSFNSGSLIIKNGAILTTGISQIASGCSMYNYGTVTFSSGLLVNSATACMNALGAKVNITGNLTGNSATFVNYGGVVATGTLGDWQNSGGVCQGDAARMSVANVNWTSINTWFETPTGSSCISYSGTATSSNFHTFSGTAGTNVCEKVGASDESGNGSWGSATLTQSCVDCNAILPVELLSFAVACDKTNENKIIAQWATASEINNSHFDLEQSADMVNFKSVAQVNGAGNSTQLIAYSIEIFRDEKNGVYYRLKQTDYDGKIAYFAAASASNCTHNNFIKVMNNSFVIDKTSFDLMGGELFDVTGRLIRTYDFSQLPAGVNKFSIDDSPSAMYVLRLQYAAYKMNEN